MAKAIFGTALLVIAAGVFAYAKRDDLVQIGARMKGSIREPVAT